MNEMHRRTTRIKLVIVSAATLCLLAIGVLITWSRARGVSAEQIPTTADWPAGFLQLCNIRLSHSTTAFVRLSSWGLIRGEAIGEADSAEYWQRVLGPELSRYPPALFKVIKV